MKKHIEPKQKRRFVSLKRVLVYGVLSCLVLVLMLFVMVCFSIRSSVKEMSAEATKEYPGNRVEALIAYVSSESHSLKKRNRAVWALGQIGDKSASAVLESFYTGGDCDHEKHLCLHELKKAIDLCKGGINLTAWLRR
jgi:HEAT repeat protein